MPENIPIPNSTSFKLVSKVKDYFQLIKFTLSFMVVFSTVVSFLIGYSEQEYIYGQNKIISVLLLFVAGMLITGSANAINQVLEKNSDALMMRTSKRPVASGRMSVNEATAFAVFAGALGVFIMWKCFNNKRGLDCWLLFYYEPLTMNHQPWRKI